MAEPVHTTVLVADFPAIQGASPAKHTLWQRLTEAITAYGGTAELQPDGVMLAYFDPLPRPDDAERAIQAALAMQVELRSLRQEQPDHNIYHVVGDLAIGINTGPSDAHASRHSNPSVTQRSATSLASIVQRIAPGNTILVSHNTYRFVRGKFSFAVLEETEDQKPAPLHCYIVLEAKPRAFYLPTRGVAAIETPMVGRQSEWAMLTEALTTAIHDGQMQIVTVVGEAGIGKSRLLYEFQNHVDLLEEEIWLFRARAVPQMIGLPYALIRQVMAFRSNILNSDTLATARNKLVQQVVRFIPEEPGEERAHFIGQLFGYNFAYSPYLRGVIQDGRQVCQRAIRAIADFFSAIADDDPVAIFLEDIQWADNASLDLLEHLGRVCADKPIVLICLARPELLERRPQWTMDVSHHARMDLMPLSHDASVELVEQILRRMSAIPDDLMETIIAGTDGNPLAIEERILLLRDWGVLSVDWQFNPKCWRDLPPTLHETLEARHAALSSGEQAVLQRAAIVGDTFWNSALGAMENLEPALKSLDKKDFIIAHEDTSFAANEEYRFKHNVVRQVAYAAIADPQQQEGEVARWRVAHSAQRVREYAGLIADHYELAGKYSQAMEYLIRAGKQAAQVGAFSEASTFFERALAIVPDSESRSRRAALTYALGEVQWHLAAYDAAHKTLDKSLYMARQIGDRQVIADTLGLMGRVACSQESYSEAKHYLQESLNIAREIGDRDGIARVENFLGEMALQMGNLDDAKQHFDQSLNIFKSLSQQLAVSQTMANLSEIAHRSGNPGGAKALGRVALAIARDNDAVPTMLEILVRLAAIEMEEGQGGAAARILSAVVNSPATTLELQVEANRLAEALELPIAANIELGIVVRDILSESS